MLAPPRLRSAYNPVSGAITVLVAFPSETLKPIVEEIVTAATDRAFVLNDNEMSHAREAAEAEANGYGA